MALNVDSCTAPQKTLRDEAALFRYLDAVDRHEKRSKLGHLLAMPHHEAFDYHASAINDESDFDSKSWIEPTAHQPKGPFYPVAFPDNTNTDLTTLDNVNYAKGIPAYVQGQVMDANSGKPIENATVEIWQACVYGKYDHPQDPNPAPADPHFQYYGKDSTTATGIRVQNDYSWGLSCDGRLVASSTYSLFDQVTRAQRTNYAIEYINPNTLSPREGLNV